MGTTVVEEAQNSHGNDSEKDRCFFQVKSFPKFALFFVILVLESFEHLIKTKPFPRIGLTFEVKPKFSISFSFSQFTKSLSDNQLDSPNRTTSSGFRRTASFQNSTSSSDSAPKDEPQPLKKQKSFHSDLPPTQMKCSLEEIEKKRLAAKYRREIKEIERRKLEAQKRLNERRARMASDMVKR